MQLYLATLALSLASIVDAQPISAIGYPGNLFFAQASSSAIAQAGTLQHAKSNFANHADSNSGNVGIAKSLVIDSNHASQEANDRGYQDATAQKNALQQSQTRTGANGAVLSPWVRHLLGNCGGLGCGGGCFGCAVPPSVLSAANKQASALNQGGTYNEANQGRASDARQHANTQQIIKRDINQKGYANANANSESNAHALSKGNFFAANNIDQNQLVVQNPGLFLRRA
ncbi:hypothetical protein SPRG_09645 [Saprolegnia parasitica CBS 223.65]|uniref:Secreted protein n=1 Tax=Saprolegnia parasitica (strain CBS 223.65) TaxID=695850 RepID=A0A067CDC3_SAPPC|nr:hypothetical protein SPRG_09645 [Saprolegnia parasitica CBS 223.65]KDO24812.1 hypothetical protein SPRG_09645 [Saprolegnia parasitica CBS 223.65]|eukprot:XP_012204460.1 hypothetical protein SPRG_09645 [Saprolegnia parasitica CBS 223.65]